MMKNIKILICLFPVILFAACADGDETNEQWRKDNKEAYEKVKNDTPQAGQQVWEALEKNHNLNGGPTDIYVKVITNGTGTEHPFQSSQVKVNYAGYFFDNPNQTFDAGGTNVTFSVDKVVRGFGTALQHMRVGDVWEICIPYYLGYGTTNYGAIKGYSTLFFKVTLVEITQYP